MRVAGARGRLIAFRVLTCPARWRPVVAVQTLNLLPTRLDLTPWASLFHRSRTITATIGPRGFNSFWVLSATLFLTTNDSVIGGSVQSTLRNDTIGPVVVDTSDLVVNADGNVTGSFSVQSTTNYTVEGAIIYAGGGVVKTSQQVATTVRNVQYWTLNATFSKNRVEHLARAGPRVLERCHTLPTGGDAGFAHHERHGKQLVSQHDHHR